MMSLIQRILARAKRVLQSILGGPGPWTPGK